MSPLVFVVATAVLTVAVAAVVAWAVARSFAAEAARHRAAADRAATEARSVLASLRSEWAKVSAATQDHVATETFPVAMTDGTVLDVEHRLGSRPAGWGAPSGTETVGELLASADLVDVTRNEDPGVRVVRRATAIVELREAGRPIDDDACPGEVQTAVNVWRREELEARLPAEWRGQLTDDEEADDGTTR